MDINELVWGEVELELDPRRADMEPERHPRELSLRILEYRDDGTVLNSLPVESHGLRLLAPPALLLELVLLPPSLPVLLAPSRLRR